MESSQYISTLVGTGADAFSNLWEITITDERCKKWYARITNVTIPMQDRKIVEIPYMNTRVYKKTPFVDLDKKFSFNIRIDENYLLYKELLGYLNAKTYDTVGGSERTFTATLSFFTAKNEVKYSATFKNCSIVSMGKTSQYTYDTSKPITIPVTVIFESKEEDDNLLRSVKKSGESSDTEGYNKKATEEANNARWWVNN